MELKLKTQTYIENNSGLLIVPYGIEISLLWYGGYSRTLLIVPYGIEIYQEIYILCHARPFNRTLWN